MKSSRHSASNTSYHQGYYYCACYVLGNSVTIFFFFLQNKSTAPRILLSIFRTISRESALCFRISEIALGFRPMRNGKIFKRIISSHWMRSSVIWRILQIEVCVMRLIDMGFFVFFFLSICFKLENMLTSIYVKLPSS